MRLGKYLAHAGVASRRAAEKLVFAGRVTVDGEVVRDPARDVGDGAEVAVDGRRAALEPGRLAVDRDRIRLPHVARRVADDLAAHRDPSGEHELLGGAPRGDARVGEELGEAHQRLTLSGAAKFRRTSDREASR